MLFTKNIAALLLGAAATLSSLAGAVPTAINVTDFGHPSTLMTRATKFSSLKGSAATWSKLSQLCAQGKKKRDFPLGMSTSLPDTPRPPFGQANMVPDERVVTWPPDTPKGFTYVPQGKSNAAFSSGNGLWTYGLVTCLGISVVGTPPSAIAEPRHLLHMESTQLVMDAQWDTFEKRVKGAKLTAMRGYMSVPDTTRNLPSTWDAGMTQLTNDIIAEARTRLTTLTGAVPTVKVRPMSRALAHETPYGTMWVDNRNEVYIEGLKA